MDDFYDEMAGVATELLAPTSQGGLGQGNIVLVKHLPKVIDPERRWEGAVTPSPVRTKLFGAATGAQEYADGKTILATDKVVTCSVPNTDWKAGDGVSFSLEIDGKVHTILNTSTIPEAGTPAAIKFIVRRGG